MTGLALAVAYQLVKPGVNLRHELHNIAWSKSQPLKLLTQTYEPKTIALTFDDGPHGHKTVETLGVLKQLDLKATFFVVGKMVDRYPWLVRTEIEMGHEVGNHTYHHLNLDKLSTADVAQEYDECSKAIKKACGVQPTFCRPPGGRFD